MLAHIKVQSIFHAISSSGSKRMKPFSPKIKATKWAKSFPSDDPHPVCTYRKMLKGSTIHWFGEGQKEGPDPLEWTIFASYLSK